MMDILSYVFEFLHKKIYEYLIPYNFLKFYCLKIKSSGNVLVMFGNVLAMYWQCSAMFVIIHIERPSLRGAQRRGNPLITSP